MLRENDVPRVTSPSCTSHPRVWCHIRCLILHFSVGLEGIGNTSGMHESRRIDPLCRVIRLLEVQLPTAVNLADGLQFPVTEHLTECIFRDNDHLQPVQNPRMKRGLCNATGLYRQVSDHGDTKIPRVALPRSTRTTGNITMSSTRKGN